MMSAHSLKQQKVRKKRQKDWGGVKSGKEGSYGTYSWLLEAKIRYRSGRDLSKARSSARETLEECARKRASVAARESLCCELAERRLGFHPHLSSNVGVPSSVGRFLEFCLPF